MPQPVQGTGDLLSARDGPAGDRYLEEIGTELPQPAFFKTPDHIWATFSFPNEEIFRTTPSGECQNVQVKAIRAAARSAIECFSCVHCPNPFCRSHVVDSC